MTRCRPSRPGFSLIELVLSIGVVSVLAVSMTSVMVLTSRAIPTSKDRDQNAIKSRISLEQLESDLAMAIEVSNRTAAGFTLKVPDRTGDTLPETIVYHWPGTGQPLTRTVNGSAAATILAGIDALEVEFSTHTRSATTTSGTTDSAEVVLASFTAATDEQLSANVLTVQGLCIVPLLDSDVTHWRLTKLRHAFTSASGSATTYTATVHPQTTSGGINELSVLATQTNTPPAATTQNQSQAQTKNQSQTQAQSTQALTTSGDQSVTSTPNSNQSSMQELSFSNVAWQPRNNGLWVVIRPGALSQFTLPAQSTAADPSYTATGSIVATLTNWTFPNRNFAWSYEALGQVRRPATTTTSTTHAAAARVRALLITGEYMLVQSRMWNEPEVK
jgi:prepilin-type N-terminal cleavage/methylation domain-containing protein